MTFYVKESNGLSSLVINKCSNECVLEAIKKESPDEICFAGTSKGHNRGLRYSNRFYLERLAANWEGSNHDFKITVIRDAVVKEGRVLNKISNIKHPNLLKILSICECSVVVEYINGYLLNTKKEKWYVGPFSYKTDYVDICTKEQLINIFKKIGEVLLLLHENGLCHTDPIDHNVMISQETGEPVLIDLIGVMPYSEEFVVLDNLVYLNHLVIPLSVRKGIDLPEEIYRLTDNRDYSLINQILYILNKCKT
jgi:tRNA A-37 threonylcarbamoyl transferase component Bud32